MKREDFDTEEEYLEFRRKANLASRKYSSKDDVKKKRAVYKKEYDQRVDIILKNKEYGKKIRSTEDYRVRMKKWREKNREHLREWANRSENKIKKAICDRKFQKEYTKRPVVQDKLRKYRKEYREENLDKIKAEHKAYYKTSRGKAVSNKFTHKRNTLLKKNKFDLSVDDICAIKKRDAVCVYCGGNQKLELDHIAPLSKGGASCYYNYVMACRSCNRSKSDRDVFKWCELQGIEIPLIIRELLILQKIKD